MNDNMTDDEVLAKAIPAATLVLFRERDGLPPELLVVERSAKMVFAGGAIVFPGGRVDVDDHQIAADSLTAATSAALDIEEAAARVAAIRETLEESGIAIGFAQAPAQDWIESARKRLHAREMFSVILAEGAQTLDLDHLIPFARWRPGFREARVFDTRFYIARAHPECPEPIVDETENVMSFWASAADLLDAADAEKVRVIFPTRRNLERLALFDSFASAHAHALAIPVEIICPVIEDRDGERHLVIPTHLGYPVTSEVMTAVTRGFKS
jgi:8-oxo-dGTP pyrophosphatase MutT (NUDIX family)